MIYDLCPQSSRGISERLRQLHRQAGLILRASFDRSSLADAIFLEESARYLIWDRQSANEGETDASDSVGGPSGSDASVRPSSSLTALPTGLTIWKATSLLVVMLLQERATRLITLDIPRC